MTGWFRKEYYRTRLYMNSLDIFLPSSNLKLQFNNNSNLFHLYYVRYKNAHISTRRDTSFDTRPTFQRRYHTMIVPCAQEHPPPPVTPFGTVLRLWVDCWDRFVSSGGRQNADHNHLLRESLVVAGTFLVMLVHFLVMLVLTPGHPGHQMDSPWTSRC